MNRIIAFVLLLIFLVMLACFLAGRLYERSFPSETRKLAMESTCQVLVEAGVVTTCGLK